MDYKMIAAMLLWALTFTGCERLNPNWCNTQGRCTKGMVCNSATNTCAERDASPDILGRGDLPPVDALQDHALSDGRAESLFERSLPADLAMDRAASAE